MKKTKFVAEQNAKLQQRVKRIGEARGPNWSGAEKFTHWEGEGNMKLCKWSLMYDCSHIWALSICSARYKVLVILSKVGCFFTV